MTQQNNMTDWIDDELKMLALPVTSGERYPTLKLEEKKITEFEVDFTKPFPKWHDDKQGLTKAVLPVTHNKERKNLWLNVKNPLYRQLVEAGKKGQKTFKVVRTGSLKDTRYELVE